jgi:hypothetical protein
MGQQTNKVQKRSRRARYIKRKRVQAKAKAPKQAAPAAT